MVDMHTNLSPMVEDLLEVTRKIVFAGLGFNYSALFNSLLHQQIKDGSAANVERIQHKLASMVQLREGFDEQFEALFGAEMVGSKIISLAFKSNQASLSVLESAFGLKQGGLLGARLALHPEKVMEQGQLLLGGRNFNFQILQGKPGRAVTAWNMLAFSDKDQNHKKSFYLTLSDPAADSIEALMHRWDEFSGQVVALA
jgi:hypothetical protein